MAFETISKWQLSLKAEAPDAASDLDPLSSSPGRWGRVGARRGGKQRGSVLQVVRCAVGLAVTSDGAGDADVGRVSARKSRAASILLQTGGSRQRTSRATFLGSLSRASSAEAAPAEGGQMSCGEAP